MSRPAGRSASLSAKLLISVSLLLVVFFGTTIAALDWVFRDLSQRSIRELLDAQLMALIAASDTDAAGNIAPARQLAEPRLKQPGSGLYAQIRGANGVVLWRSESLLGTPVEFGQTAAPGSRVQMRLPFGSDPADSKREIMALSAGFDWETSPGASRHLVFSVATDLSPYEAQLHRFRAQMFGWFLGLMVALLVALALLLRRLLTPLRVLEREIREIESGEREQLGTALPREVLGLATNTNALLASERKRVERYRNTLGNLAHSLKTPLAVIRSTLSEPGAFERKASVVNDNVDRMDAIVQHQLKRAAASGGSAVGQAAIPVAPLLTELRNALVKVYGTNKDLLIELNIAAELQFQGDRGDLLELTGNLLDNACKWCRSLVRVTAERTNDGARRRVRLIVEDDGPGIPVHERSRILERGARADEHTPGQGIGLAMVREIVELYGGELTMTESALGGARIIVVLPGR